MKKIILLIIACFIVCHSECVVENYNSLRYTEYSEYLLKGLKTIRQWLDVDDYDYIDATFTKESYSDGTTGIDDVTISSPNNGRKVIIVHKHTNNTTWVDIVYIHFIDENDITYKTKKVNYDLPKTLYRRACL